MTFNGPVYINTTGSELTGVANKPCPPTDCAKLQDDTISSGSQRQTRFSSVATSNASQTSEAMPTAEQAIAEWPWPNGNISSDIQAGSLLELQCGMAKYRGKITVGEQWRKGLDADLSMPGSH